MSNPVDEWNTILDSQVADGTKNDADIRSDTNYTPEQQRVYKNGSRVLLQYEDISANSDFSESQAGDEDVFVMSPSAGDTLQIRTAKQLLYSVSYTTELTQAVALNQSITNTDDRLVVGIDTTGGDLNDGYFFKHTGADADDEGVLETRRNGNTVGDALSITLREAITFFRRLGSEYAWYNIAGSEWFETTTRKNGIVETELETQTTEPDDSNAGAGGRGPLSGSGQIVVEVEADSSTTGLECYVGSTSYKTLGEPTDQLFGRGYEETGLSVGSASTYEPLFAFRKNPNFSNTTLAVPKVTLTDGPNGKVQIRAMDSSNVLDSSGNELSDSDFSAPNDVSSNVVPIETTDGSTVNQFADESGSTTTSADAPGGYQIGIDITRASKNAGIELERSAQSQESKGLHDGDLGVVVGNMESTSSSIKVFVDSDIDQ